MSFHVPCTEINAIPFAYFAFVQLHIYAIDAIMVHWFLILFSWQRDTWRDKL